MKVLSLYQPWATLVVIGAKKFETRSWSTKYRGPLMIHSSKRYKAEDQLLRTREPFFSALRDESPWTGMILGKVDLVDCITTESWLDSRIRSHGRMQHLVMARPGQSIYLTSEDWREYEFGNYAEGRFAWKLENPVKFDEPISARGSLGLWEFHESALGHLANESQHSH